MEGKNIRQSDLPVKHSEILSQDKAKGGKDSLGTLYIEESWVLYEHQTKRN